jgi:hypothetical protein
MSRKPILDPDEQSGNRQPASGDAFEPDDTSDLDLDFDPAKLEKSDAAAEAPDPYDTAALRLSQDFSASVGVKKALLSVPVGKPDPAKFVRVHPDPAYRLQTLVIELKSEREIYLVNPALWPELAAESTFGPRAFYTAMDRQNNLFFWQIKLPGPDGKIDEWNRTALEAANLAVKSWVRVAANRARGAYDVFQATGQLKDPEWPNVPLKDILRIAFKDKRIDTFDHPVLRKLRGEV